MQVCVVVAASILYLSAPSHTDQQQLVILHVYQKAFFFYLSGQYLARINYAVDLEST